FLNLRRVDCDFVVLRFRTAPPAPQIPDVHRAAGVAAVDHQVAAIAARACIAGLWCGVIHCVGVWLTGRQTSLGPSRHLPPERSKKAPEVAHIVRPSKGS